MSDITVTVNNPHDTIAFVRERTQKLFPRPGRVVQELTDQEFLRQHLQQVVNGWAAEQSEYRFRQAVEMARAGDLSAAQTLLQEAASR